VADSLHYGRDSGTNERLIGNQAFRKFRSTPAASVVHGYGRPWRRGVGRRRRATLLTLRCSPCLWPRSSVTAVPSDTAATAPTQRDRHLQVIAEKGRMGWQKASGYTKRAKVEAAIGRWKQVIGDGLRSRKDERRATEVAVARPCPQPHAGAGAPDLRPHRLTSGRHSDSLCLRPDPCTTAAKRPPLSRAADESSLEEPRSRAG